MRLEKFRIEFHGDHTSTYIGASKAHDWMVSVLGPLLRTAAEVNPDTRSAPSMDSENTKNLPCKRICSFLSKMCNFRT
jgi:hypothetical protein